MAEYGGFRADIEEIVRKLSLAPEEFRAIGIHQWEGILIEILDRVKK